MIEEQFVYDNQEEAEMGQINALHLTESAVAAVQRKIKTGPSLEECEECGEPIPEARRLAITGCTTCILCQTRLERRV